MHVYRPPAAEPVIAGKLALAEHYGSKRFNLPALHAELCARMVLGDKVVDHERVHGVRPAPFEAAAVYQVIDGLIAAVWFFEAAP